MTNNQFEFETLKVTHLGLNDHQFEGIALVEINRPSLLNALNPKFWTDLTNCFNLLSTDSDTKCIVLSGGSSKVFTSGKDPARAALESIHKIKIMQNAVTCIEKCLKPVIAAVHGACIGAGVDLVTACDIRLATEDAFFAIKEVDLGITADLGVLQRLPKLVGNISWVKDIVLTGRKVSPKEALYHGLLSRVYTDKQTMLDEAIILANQISGKSPVAIVGTKHIVNYALDHSIEEGINYVSLWNAAMLNTKDVETAIKAYLQKKKPTYSKL